MFCTSKYDVKYIGLVSHCALSRWSHYPPFKHSTWHGTFMAHYLPFKHSTWHGTFMAHYPPFKHSTWHGTFMAHYPPFKHIYYYYGVVLMAHYLPFNHIYYYYGVVSDLRCVLVDILPYTYEP